MTGEFSCLEVARITVALKAHRERAEGNRADAEQHRLITAKEFWAKEVAEYDALLGRF